MRRKLRCFSIWHGAELLVYLVNEITGITPKSWDQYHIKFFSQPTRFKFVLIDGSIGNSTLLKCKAGPSFILRIEPRMINGYTRQIYFMLF